MEDLVTGGDDLDEMLAEGWLDFDFASVYHGRLLLTADPGVHAYISTACLHGDHDYCNSTVRRNDEQKKVPAQCKTCEASCLCPICHREEPLTRT